MPGRLVGHHIGRDVMVSSLSDLLNDLWPGRLSHATVLLWVSEKSSLEALIQRAGALSSASPLALFAAGAESEAVFDVLLNSQSVAAPEPHVMTGCSAESLDQCLDDFLLGTWPAEERMESWTTYLLAGDDVIGEDALASAVLRWLGAAS